MWALTTWKALSNHRPAAARHWDGKKEGRFRAFLRDRRKRSDGKWRTLRERRSPLCLYKAIPHNSAAALAMHFPPSAACKTLDLPPVNLRVLPLHQTKNAPVIALPHWGGIAFKWNLFIALAFAAFRRETASCRCKCHQDFWVKLVWQRLQVTVTTPLPRGRRSHALQLGQRKYLYCLRFLKRFFA